MKRLFLLLILIAGYTQAAKPAPTINEPLKIWNRQTNGRTAFTDGTVLEPGTYAVQVEVNPQTESVRIVIDDQAQPPENTSPYTGPDFTVNPGNHIVVATPYSADNASGIKGASVTVNFTVSGATPTPTPTVPPSPSPTPTATASPTPSSSPTPSATPTTTPTATPLPTPTPTPSSTPSPSPTPTPTGPLVTVTVEWTATVADEYSIFYGKTPAADDMQVYGGHAWAAGPMCVAIANLDANTTYYFTDAVTWYDVTGPKLQPPVAYTTTSASNQKVNLP